MKYDEKNYIITNTLPYWENSVFLSCENFNHEIEKKLIYRVRMPSTALQLVKFYHFHRATMNWNDGKVVRVVENTEQTKEKIAHKFSIYGQHKDIYWDDIALKWCRSARKTQKALTIFVFVSI